MSLTLPPLPPTTRVSGKTYRIISTCYPPVDFFERHVPPEMMEALWALEADTNPRLKQETGELSLVPVEDRVSGPGASIVMASFTHIGRVSRFSRGDYGVYYAARSVETAIRETVHQKQLVAGDAQLSATEFSMRTWIGTVRKALHDIRAPKYKALHDDAPRPEDHLLAQAFGRTMRQENSWGMFYRSVRHKGGECIAALRPPAVSLPTQGALLVYVWNGSKITHVYEKSEPIIEFQ